MVGNCLRSDKLIDLISTRRSHRFSRVLQDLAPSGCKELMSFRRPRLLWSLWFLLRTSNSLSSSVVVTLPSVQLLSGDKYWFASVCYLVLWLNADDLGLPDLTRLAVPQTELEPRVGSGSGFVKS